MERTKDKKLIIIIIWLRLELIRIINRVKLLVGAQRSLFLAESNIARLECQSDAGRHFNDGCNETEANGAGAEAVDGVATWLFQLSRPGFESQHREVGRLPLDRTHSVGALAELCSLESGQAYKKFQSRM